MAKQSILERIAEEDLRQYSLKEKAVETLPMQIKTLEYRYEAIRASSADAAPVSGGTNHREDALIANISERDYMRAKLKEARGFIAAINKALEVLDEREHLVVDLFYMHGGRNNLERLMNELNLEKSQIYRIRDLALYKFTCAYFGSR